MSEEPLRSNRKGRRTYEHLLETAVSIWSESGLPSVTITAVAERAGKTRRTVYQHFADRDVLIEALKGHLDTQLAKLTDGHADAFPDPYGLVAGLAVDSLELVRSRVFDMLSIDSHDNPLIQDALQYFHVLSQRGVLKEGVDPEHAAVMTISMWYASILAVSLGRTDDERRDQAKRFSKSFVDIMSRGAFVDGYRAGSHDPPIIRKRKRRPPQASGAAAEKRPSR